MSATAALIARRRKLLDDARALLVPSADGKVSQETVEKFGEIEAEAARLEKLIGSSARIDDMERISEEEASSKSEAAQAASFQSFRLGGPSPIQVMPKDKERFFANFGEMLQAVTRSYNGGVTDTRLFTAGLGMSAAAPLGMNVGSPTDGGFLVQKDYSMRLFNLMHEQGQLLSRVTRIKISSNADGIKLPVIDEASRVTGSRWGGVRSYWVAEANTVTSSAPKVGLLELGLHKIMSIGYVTSELLNDTSVLEGIMEAAFREETTFMLESAVMWGNGVGKPLGFMNAPGLVTVAKESSQSAAGIITLNILNMWSRLSARSQRSAVWLINADCQPQLFQLTLGSGTAVVQLYRPPGVDGPNVNAPAGTLLGRPVIPIEHASTMGTVGDIVLVDLSDYLMSNKEEARYESSMHVQFLTDQTAYRLTYRTDGQPATRLPMTPANGTSTTSPYVALATRP